MQVARYFPVKPSVFRFQAGLLPFGSDCGNGVADALYFQFDAQAEHYLQAKARVAATRHAVLARNDAEARAHARVLDWIGATLQREHPDRFPDRPASLRAVGARVQEDLVIIQRGPDGRDAAIGVDVSFPSDWRPERIVGTDFRFIHGPVPGFADTDTQARALVGAMIDRGPYVRFVWTLKADDHLDHHPDLEHPAWSPHGPAFLRVERQVTVPFADVGAALFLIRTYLYRLAALSPEERGVLAHAVRTMPAPAADYKGISGRRELILSLLDER